MLGIDVVLPSTSPSIHLMKLLDDSLSYYVFSIFTLNAFSFYRVFNKDFKKIMKKAKPNQNHPNQINLIVFYCKSYKENERKNTRNKQ